MTQQSSEELFPIGKIVDIILGTHMNVACYRGIGRITDILNKNRRSIHILKVFYCKGKAFDNFTKETVQSIHVDHLFAH